jgi:hypothetical protein
MILPGVIRESPEVGQTIIAMGVNPWFRDRTPISLAQQKVEQ